MKHYPAVDVSAANIDLLYCALDDFSPTAIEERTAGLRAFFLTSADRDAAQAALSKQFDSSPIDVPDDDWARRSQEGLQPVTIGRITIVPNRQSSIQSASSSVQAAMVVIAPSMGFGTGHHATTRLCLAALQDLDLRSKSVLDIGTGSGVLAIAARVLGADRATGVDSDPDAIQSARENLTLNPAVSGVAFEVADLATAHLAPADVVTANLTGALLARAATTLLDATAPGGVLILSGLMTSERDQVATAFGAGAIVEERVEDEWIGLTVKKS